MHEATHYGPVYVGSYGEVYRGKGGGIRVVDLEYSCRFYPGNLLPDKLLMKFPKYTVDRYLSQNYILHFLIVAIATVQNSGKGSSIIRYLIVNNLISWIDHD